MENNYNPTPGQPIRPPTAINDIVPPPFAPAPIEAPNYGGGYADIPVGDNQGQEKINNADEKKPEKDETPEKTKEKEGKDVSQDKKDKSHNNTSTKSSYKEVKKGKGSKTRTPTKSAKHDDLVCGCFRKIQIKSQKIHRILMTLIVIFLLVPYAGLVGFYGYLTEFKFACLSEEATRKSMFYQSK